MPKSLISVGFSLANLLILSLFGYILLVLLCFVASLPYNDLSWARGQCRYQFLPVLFQVVGPGRWGGILLGLIICLHTSTLLILKQVKNKMAANLTYILIFPISFLTIGRFTPNFYQVDKIFFVYAKTPLKDTSDQKQDGRQLDLLTYFCYIS